MKRKLCSETIFKAKTLFQPSETLSDETVTAYIYSLGQVTNNGVYPFPLSTGVLF